MKTKYAYDDLNTQAQLDALTAVKAHRDTLKFPYDLGYPFAYWSEFNNDLCKDLLCIEYYLPENNETKTYKYYKDKSNNWLWM